MNHFRLESLVTSYGPGAVGLVLEYESIFTTEYIPTQLVPSYIEISYTSIFASPLQTDYPLHSYLSPVWTGALGPAWTRILSRLRT